MGNTIKQPGKCNFEKVLGQINVKLGDHDFHNMKTTGSTSQKPGHYDFDMNVIGEINQDPRR